MINRSFRGRVGGYWIRRLQNVHHSRTSVSAIFLQFSVLFAGSITGTSGPCENCVHMKEYRSRSAREHRVSRWRGDRIWWWGQTQSTALRYLVSPHSQSYWIHPTDTSLFCLFFISRSRWDTASLRQRDTVFVALGYSLVDNANYGRGISGRGRTKQRRTEENHVATEPECAFWFFLAVLRFSAAELCSPHGNGKKKILRLLRSIGRANICCRAQVVEFWSVSMAWYGPRIWTIYVLCTHTYIHASMPVLLCM
jgi:hypothetical protein